MKSEYSYRPGQAQRGAFTEDPALVGIDVVVRRETGSTHTQFFGMRSTALFCKTTASVSQDRWPRVDSRPRTTLPQRALNHECVAGGKPIPEERDYQLGDVKYPTKPVQVPSRAEEGAAAGRDVKGRTSPISTPRTR